MECKIIYKKVLSVTLVPKKVPGELLNGSEARKTNFGAMSLFAHNELCRSTIADPLVLALVVVWVARLAGTGGTFGGARVALSTALSVERYGTSSGRRSSSRLGDGGHSRRLSGGRLGGGRSSGGRLGRGRLGRRDLLSSGLSSAVATANPGLGAGHGERLASVVDAEVGVWVGRLVSTREL